MGAIQQILLSTGTTSGGGGTGNAWTLVQSNSNSGTSVTLPAPPTAGNLLVVGFKCEGAGTGLTCVCGTDTLTAGTQSDGASGDLHCLIFYKLVTVQTITGIVAVTGTSTFQRIIAREYSATGTHALDAQAASASGNSVSVASGTASSAVSNGLAIGLYGEYTNTTASVQKIGSANATNIVTQSNTVLWDLLFSSTQSSVTANCTITPSSNWTAALALFKST